MRIISAVTAALSLALVSAPAAAWQQPLYHVSGAGQANNSTGLNNPYTLLRRPEAQAIAMACAEVALTEAQLTDRGGGGSVPLPAAP